MLELQACTTTPCSRCNFFFESLTRIYSVKHRKAGKTRKGEKNNPNTNEVKAKGSR
jgi:hypothetical protein